MAQSPAPQSLLGHDPWIFSQGWSWAQAQVQVQVQNAGLGSGTCAGASWGSPAACSGAQATPECLGNRVPDPSPWVTPPYYPKMQSPLHPSRGRAPDASLWMPPQACSGAQTSPEPGNLAIPWTPPPAPPELAAVYQAISVSPEACLSSGDPPLVPRPSCQRLQPQIQWGCWSDRAELLPGSEDQGSTPTFQLSEAGPPQSSDLQLSGCPELWQEDLEGAHLDIFY
ncbi:mesoderm posterior protein 2 [Tupaia chinensis]|uniref:mesoderm posterior protein 2 n=1 Tax=Tupaia chinensis TaxID=246437 RepID=UPI000704214D|nr:mesoderm posterior protein 2 [Tupaia chinensis]